MLNVRQHGADLPDVDMTFPCGSRCRSPIADAMVGSRPSVNPLPHPESLPLFALSQRRSAFLTRRRISRQGQLPQEPWLVQIG